MAPRRFVSRLASIVLVTCLACSSTSKSRVDLTDSGAGAGGTAGSVATGGDSGSAGTAATGGVAGTAGSAGVSGTAGTGGACTPQCGNGCGEVDDGCGSTITCACSGTDGCMAGSCEEVVAINCGAVCTFGSPFVGKSGVEGCPSGCPSGGQITVCVKSGGGFGPAKVQVLEESQCPSGWHLALTRKSCAGPTWIVCIKDP